MNTDFEKIKMEALHKALSNQEITKAIIIWWMWDYEPWDEESTDDMDDRLYLSSLNIQDALADMIEVGFVKISEVLIELGYVAVNDEINKCVWNIKKK